MTSTPTQKNIRWDNLWKSYHSLWCDFPHYGTNKGLNITAYRLSYCLQLIHHSSSHYCLVNLLFQSDCYNSVTDHPWHLSPPSPHRLNPFQHLFCGLTAVVSAWLINSHSTTRFLIAETWLCYRITCTSWRVQAYTCRNCKTGLQLHAQEMFTNTRTGTWWMHMYTLYMVMTAEVILIYFILHVR